MYKSNYVKIWTIKRQVINNSRLFKSLGYFDGFKAIYKDNTTYEGYYIEFYVKRG